MLDTGIFDDDRYWVVDVQYAKADPTDILMTISVTNAGPDTELLHVLPTHVVPQHLVLGRRWQPDRRSRPHRAGTCWPSTIRSSVELELLAGPDPQRRSAGAAVL